MSDEEAALMKCDCGAESVYVGGQCEVCFSRGLNASYSAYKKRREAEADATDPSWRERREDRLRELSGADSAGD